MSALQAYLEESSVDNMVTPSWQLSSCGEGIDRKPETSAKIEWLSECDVRLYIVQWAWRVRQSWWLATHLALQQLSMTYGRKTALMESLYKLYRPF